jgi:hypothetical protein
VEKWIDLNAIWRIVVVGLLAGAGLPVLVAIGLRALSLPAGGSGGDSATVAANPARVAFAVLCFAVVLAAIGYGIYLIVAGGH